MNTHGHATLGMFKLIADNTYNRAVEFFNTHPEAFFAYWGKDEFLPDYADENERKAFKERHPEIEDELNDHTTIRLVEDNMIRYRDFCPRLRSGIQEIWNEYSPKSKDIIFDTELGTLQLQQDPAKPGNFVLIYRRK